jgi:hypothetical protein
MPQTATGSNIIEMLKADHKKVKALFEEFEDALDAKTQQQLVNTALMELEIHAALEEKLIYPAFREEFDDEDLMDEALEEHHLVHRTIAELKKMKPRDDRFKAKFTVLGESVKHHIEEEESEMLPKAEESDIDWEALEKRVQKRKEQLASKFSSVSRNGKATRGKAKSRAKR